MKGHYYNDIASKTPIILFVMGVFLLGKGDLMEKLQLHILNDYSGSLRRNNGVDTFVPMISFRENVIHPYIVDVLETKFNVSWKIHYVIDGKLKTFNKAGDPVLKNNQKYKNNSICSGVGLLFDHVKKVYGNIKNSKALIIVISDNVWCTTPEELKEFNDTVLADQNCFLINVNLNQDVRLEEQDLFKLAMMPHINFIDQGFDEEFEDQINTFLEI